VLTYGFIGDAATSTFSKIVLSIWSVLMIPWLLVAGMAGVAFDGGARSAAYMFVWSVWTYPIVLLIAVIFRKKSPLIIWLPFLNFVVPFLEAISIIR
jgi:hypothetical protein